MGVNQSNERKPTPTERQHGNSIQKDQESNPALPHHSPCSPTAQFSAFIDVTQLGIGQTGIQL